MRKYSIRFRGIWTKEPSQSLEAVVYKDRIHRMIAHFKMSLTSGNIGPLFESFVRASPKLKERFRELVYWNNYMDIFFFDTIELKHVNFESHKHVTDWKYYKEKYLTYMEKSQKHSKPNWKLQKTEQYWSTYTLWSNLSPTHFFPFVIFAQIGKKVDVKPDRVPSTEPKKEKFYMTDSLSILSNFIEENIVIDIPPELQTQTYSEKAQFIITRCDDNCIDCGSDSVSHEGNDITVEKGNKKKKLCMTAVEWFSDSDEFRQTSMLKLYEELDAPKLAILFFKLNSYITFKDHERGEFYKPAIRVDKILLLDERGERKYRENCQINMRQRLEEDEAMCIASELKNGGTQIPEHEQEESQNHGKRRKMELIEEVVTDSEKKVMSKNGWLPQSELSLFL